MMGGGGLKDVHPDAPADPSPDPASDATSVEEEAAFAAHGRALVGVWIASLMWAVAFGTGDDA